MGDVVQTIPLLNKLRRRYPKARIDWLVTPPTDELLRDNPAISNVVEFPCAAWSAPWHADAVRQCGAADRRAARGAIRPGARSARPVAQRRIRLRFRRAGADRLRQTARGRDGRHRRAKSRSRRKSTPGRARARAAGSPIPITSRCRRSTCIQSSAISASRRCSASMTARPIFPSRSHRRLRPASMLCSIITAPPKPRLIAIAPGTNWETKQWRADAFAETARHFLQKSCAVVLIGSDRERAVCEDVARLAPGAVNLAGETTLSELAALVRRTSVCVTNDSGPVHLAVALDRAVVSVFGPTDPVWAGPLSSRQCGAARAAGVLALLPAAIEPLQFRPCLHEGRNGIRGHRARRRHSRQAAGAGKNLRAAAEPAIAN